ncbi:4-hydroxybenzoate octaprenyltransferase [Sphingomonas changnyeongensis]|uniref:4-hydroxybenzoate octaprenyltransferase n=1 Tax=Sphingomonas changnyeongensis TaxID=2698679 RepID=A0A7Z2NTT1_9SPHN|nr:4-hydroxybenzoate octaprenyltransferase [Sphingomonas changnyeongensis]QHL89720.1 4-hydroxybenzoate octaprenyltransferase [Sphingomonas changnyeongensis]
MSTVLPDTEHRRLAASGRLRPYILLARLDRPIGWWLLFWPCAWGVALAGGAFSHLALLAWLLLGSVAMRGAGCVYNDIIDRDLDARVARTRGRPLAAGLVSLKAAWAWLLILCGIGLVVLVQLQPLAIVIALASLAPVAAYPFMKRITWWPQAWLGMVFSWGALVGWAATLGTLGWPAVALYLGTVAWVVGYDTIYALQDREDDALVGIRSSALALGGRVRAGIGFFYALALIGWAVAIWGVRAEPLALVALAPAALHLLWQVMALEPGDADDALGRFRSNRMAGLLVFLACLTVGTGAG